MSFVPKVWTIWGYLGGLALSGAGIRVGRVTLALYRTYRPGTLAEVIGQEHVTGPMARALDAGRTHHAYLLSGPRGCGKTSTARILARSMNCVEGPSSTPCGKCQSCLDLAPNGPGSIDVVELDAATHRGIDDARDLREKAIFAPAVGQYRVYIIDEAHQLTKEAANALLKLIEEPPPHLRFIFATTEPDKILPTIRSRTFHYGFRLVPAGVLAEHLATVCDSEGVPAETAALAAVARAGAGSVRDSLSVLGQLLAGAGPQGLTYADAVLTLGLTDDSLLEAFVQALSEGSVAQMFQVVDRVIAGGHDPRRFTADLLDRLRDLLIVRADPGALANGVIEVADDAGERLLTQSQSLGQAELSRAADLINAGLSELKGATAPRLQLELLCARLALAPAQGDAGALLARLERLERQLASGAVAAAASSVTGVCAAGAGVPNAPAAGTTISGTGVAAAAATPASGSAPAGAADPAPVATPVEMPATGSGRGAGAAQPAAAQPAAAQPPAGPPSAAGTSAPAGRQTGGATPPRRPQLRSRQSGGDATAAMPASAGRAGGEPATISAAAASAAPDSDSASAQVPPTGRNPAPRTSAPATHDRTQAAPSTAAGGSATRGGAGDTDAGEQAGQAGLARVKEAWESVLEALFGASRVAWTAFGGARPLSLQDGVLAVGVPEAGAVRAITLRGHDERLRQVLIDVLGLDVSVDVMHEGRAAAPAAAPSPAAGSAGSRGAARPAGQSSGPGGRGGRGGPGRQEGPGTQGGPAAGGGSSAGGDASGPGTASTGATSRAAAVGRAVAASQSTPAEVPDEPSDDDPDFAGGDGLALIERELGARTIGEIDHA